MYMKDNQENPSQSWSKTEIIRLKADWVAYKQKLISPDALRSMYKGRTVDSIGKKFHKVYGRAIFEKKEPGSFQAPSLFPEQGEPPNVK